MFKKKLLYFFFYIRLILNIINAKKTYKYILKINGNLNIIRKIKRLIDEIKAIKNNLKKDFKYRLRYQ